MPPPAAELHGPPVAAIVIAVVMGLIVLLPVGLAAVGARRARRVLHGCPRCGASAVRDLRWENLSVSQTRVTLQCGQCELWRRAEVDDIDRRAQERRLRRDRLQIERALRRLEPDRPAPAIAGRRTADEQRRSP